MTRAQKLFRDISFESETHDIYNPQYSSDADSQSEKDRLDDEEAEGKICDERVSHLNPCEDSSLPHSFTSESLESVNN